MGNKKFRFTDYIGRYAMHCPEKWQAEIFFQKMAKEKSYLWEGFGVGVPPYSGWEINKHDTCYGFNECTLGPMFHYDGYKILEFDDFDWGHEKDLSMILIILSLILESKDDEGSIVENGFCPCCGNKVLMCKLSEKRFMRCKSCEKTFYISES